MEDAEFYVTHLNRWGLEREGGKEGGRERERGVTTYIIFVSYNRPEGAADIRYAESCMKNGFGLRYLHKFLSIPFLQLQV